MFRIIRRVLFSKRSGDRLDALLEETVYSAIIFNVAAMRRQRRTFVCLGEGEEGNGRHTAGIRRV